MFRTMIARREWRWPRVLIALMIIELAGTVAGLALFGIAQPDLFRTKLWRIGFDNGFNSSPAQILYAYANHQPLFKTPFVWSGSLTDYNVAVSVLAMFILLVKCTMFVLHIWFPFFATITNAALTAMWIVSMYGQMGPDYTDPARPSPIAWYITKSCSYAEPTGNTHYCLMAKGTFATTVVMAAIFLLNTLLGVYSLIPTAEERANAKMEMDDMQETANTNANYNMFTSTFSKRNVNVRDSPVSDAGTSDKEWEMKNVEKNRVPFTPRTLAFNTLDRQLPLRAAQANGRWA